MIQGSSKLKNYSLRWLFKPLRLSKFDSFLIQVCTIVAFSGIPESNLLISLSFLLDRTFSMMLLSNFSLPSSQSFPLFYSVILSPGELLIPLFCPLGTRACVVPVAQKVQFSLFFILSFLLVLFLWKSMADYLFRSALRSRSSQFSFCRPSSLSFFSNGRNPTLLVRKSFAATPFFIPPSFWFPEVPSTCTMRSHSRFSSFLARSFGTWEGRAHPLFLVFF